MASLGPSRFPSKFFVTSPRSPPSEPNAKPTQRRYHYLDVPPPPGMPTRATILLLHGFPDSSFGWRKILSPLSLAGYRCIAPDMLGYALTSSPDKETRLAEYGSHALSLDLEELMDSVVGKDAKFVVVGHDWGSFLAWRVVKWLPDRVYGVTGICVPYAPPTSEYLPIENMLELLPQFGYQAFFAQDRSTKIVKDNLDKFLTLVFSSPGLFTSSTPADRVKPTSPSSSPKELDDWTRLGALEQFLTSPEPITHERWARFRKACLLNDEEMRYYKGIFGGDEGGKREKGGIDGGLNWYRNRLVNFKEDRAIIKDKLLPAKPYLMLVPTMDSALPPWMGESMRKTVPAGGKFTKIEIEGAGHWVALELPGVVSTHILNWLNDDIAPLLPAAQGSTGVVGAARDWWNKLGGGGGAAAGNASKL